MLARFLAAPHLYLQKLYNKHSLYWTSSIIQIKTPQPRGRIARPSILTMADKENPQKELPGELPTLPQQRLAGPGSLNRTAPEKTSWPELVGLTSEEAQRRIKEEIPGANVQVIPSGCFVTMDFRLDRVRIFTDSSGKVEREPSIG